MSNDDALWDRWMSQWRFGGKAFARANLPGGYPIYDSRPGFPGGRNGMLRCVECGGTTMLSMVSSESAAKIGCENCGTLFSHPWVFPETVRDLVALNAKLQHGQPLVRRQSLVQRQELPFRPLVEIPTVLCAYAQPGRKPELRQRAEWETGGGDPVCEPFSLATYWAARMFAWSLNHAPPTGWPKALDSDRTDEHMAVVLLALAIYEEGWKAGVRDLSDVPLPGVLAALSEQRGLKTAAVSPNGVETGRLRVSDRARLKRVSSLSHKEEWTRWRSTAAHVTRVVADYLQTFDGDDDVTVYVIHDYVPESAVSWYWQ